MTCTICHNCHLCFSSDVTCSEKVFKSLENIKIRNNLKYLTINLRDVPPHYMASIVCGCLQSTTVKELNFTVDHVKVIIIKKVTLLYIRSHT